MKKNLMIRAAKKKDVRLIMNFIRNNWDKNHILARDYKFFCYEFLNKEKINFFLAFINKKLEAIQGFILYGNKKNVHTCGSITCVSSKSSRPYLGIEIMQNMLQINKPQTYCGIGTNPKTMLPLVKKFFKRTTGSLDHYYILNNDLPNYIIATVVQKKIFP